MRRSSRTTAERVHEAGHALEDNGACLMMRVMSTIRHQSALCGTSNTVNDCIELGRQAVLIVGSLDREHGAGDQRQPIDDRPSAHCRAEPKPRPAAEQAVCLL